MSNGNIGSNSSKSGPILKFFRSAAEPNEAVVTFEHEGSVLQLSSDETQQVLNVVGKRDRPEHPDSSAEEGVFKKALMSSSPVSGSQNSILRDSLGNGTDLMDPNPPLIPLPFIERTTHAPVAPSLPSYTPPLPTQPVGESPASSNVPNLSLASLKSEITNIVNAFTSDLSVKLDSVFVKLNLLEDLGSHRDEEIRRLQEETQHQSRESRELRDRIRELEAGMEIVTTQGVPGRLQWRPSNQVGTNIAILGDSNITGKVLFGSEKGTLGPALPGESRFIPTIPDLPIIDRDSLTNFSALVVAVGTNSLIKPEAVPSALAMATHEFVRMALDLNPALHILLAGVIPTDNSEVNQRIDSYNVNLKSMAAYLPRTTFLDTGFLKTREGLLQGKYGATEGRPFIIHLNSDGIRMYASRLKRALREIHNLPTSAPSRFVNTDRDGGQFARGGYRGRGGSRGRDFRGGSRGRGGPGRGDRGQGRGGGSTRETQQMETQPSPESRSPGTRGLGRARGRGSPPPIGNQGYQPPV